MSHENSRHRSINSPPSDTLTMTSHGTFLSKQPLTATCHANTAQGRKEMTTWTFSSLSRSSMKRANMAPGALVCTSLENPSSIPTSLRLSGTLRKRTKSIRSFLRRMERYLTNSPMSYWNYQLTESSGLTGETTLTMELYGYSGKSDSSDFSSKKPRKKSLKNGRNSHGSK